MCTVKMDQSITALGTGGPSVNAVFVGCPNRSSEITAQRRPLGNARPRGQGTIAIGSSKWCDYRGVRLLLPASQAPDAADG